VLVFANVFQPLIDFFEAILVFLHDDAGFSWGWAIVVMTVVIRACLLPLTLKQFKSMRALAAHAPEMKKLQERYKGDKERLNQEMMKFYRENRINPLASCLPMVAQLPVFLSLFYMLQKDLRFDICGQVAQPCGETPESSFLFIPDLTSQAHGTVLIALIVLYVGSQVLSTLLSATTADKTQRMIFLALPFVFVAFVINFPAGLLVYWITTNLWTIVQQAIIRRRLGPMTPPGGESMGLGALLKGAGATSAASESDGKPKPRARATGGGEVAARPAGPPPTPPRKKKKRSGRRR
jgi:YidC/Oxa1 family membrane protein insertase